MTYYFKKIQNVLGKAFNFSLGTIKPIRTITLIIALVGSLTSTPLLAAEEDPHRPFNWMRQLTSLFSSKSIEKGSPAVITIKKHTGVGFVVQDDKTKKFILVTAFNTIEDVDLSNLKFMNQGNPLKIKRIWSASIEQNVISFELEDYNGYVLKPADSPDYNSDEGYIPGHPNAYFSDIKGPTLHNVSSSSFGIISDETVDSSQTGGSSVLKDKRVGSPVLNDKEEIIGMYLQKDFSAPGIYFAVKIEHIKNLLRKPEICVDNPDVFLTDSFEEQIKYLQFLLSHKYSLLNDFYFNNGTYMTEYFSGEAFSRLKDIAENGSANAQFKAGLQLYFGEGVPQNKEQAAFRFGQAAGQEHPAAEVMLLGLNNKLQFFQQIRKGRAEGIYLLAQKQYKGEGIPQDKEKASWNFRTAIIGYFFIEQTSQLDEWINKLLMHDEPIGSDFNETIRKRILNEIEEHTFTFPHQYEAAFRVAVMLYNGDGIPQRRGEAFFWFSKILRSFQLNVLQKIDQLNFQLKEINGDLLDEAFDFDTYINTGINTGEDLFEKLVETTTDENQFKELMELAAIRSQMDELNKILKKIREIVFAVRSKAIVMMKTGDGLSSKQEVADQWLYEGERMMTQKEWNYITEPDEITEMKRRIREVRNSVIPKIDTETESAMIMERIRAMEEMKRSTQGRQSEEGESQSSLCSNEFISNKQGPSEEQIEK